MHIDMNLTDSILHNIIIESINKLLLTEDRGSRSMKSARNYALQVLGDKQEAVNLVNKVRNDLELHNAAEAFVLAGTRMNLNNEYDDTTKEKLVSVIKLIAAKYLDQYTNDLNGLLAQELISKHSPEVKAMRDNERNEVPQEFDGESDYQIVRIDSFYKASEYHGYVDWCITIDESYYNSYTSNGLNQFYFCLKNGFEQVPQEQGENFPLDDYGLSMFAVLVNNNGDLIGCTTRWNLSDSRDQMAMNVKQISNVIKMDFYKVFKPSVSWSERVNDAIQRLSNDGDPYEIFDKVVDGPGWITPVSLCGKWNIMDGYGEIVFPKVWFNYCGRFSEGFVVVELNHKYNYIGDDCKLLYGELNKPEEWFDWCGSFTNGFGKVDINDKMNFINQNGEIIYKPNEPDKWFEFEDDFKGAYAKVLLGDNVYYLDRNGNITEKEPKVSESFIRNVNELNYNRNMKQRIRLTESDLHNIVSKSVNKILNEISDVNKQWESEKRAFLRGLKDGKAYVDGDTVYVEIGGRNDRDPRYVYFKFGGNKLMDDHFYVQSSPKLSKRCIENIYLLLNFVYGVDVSEYID